MLREWPKGSFGELYERMKRDFPANERPPKAALVRQLRPGRLKAFQLDTDRCEGAAYALLAGKEGILITHLAVEPALRNKGYGTLLMNELKDTFKAQSDFLIVEVELPEKARDEAERKLREKRIAFYERIGFIGYEKLSYSIFGVPMRVMAWSVNGKPLPSVTEIEDMVKSAYRLFLPALLMGQVRF